MSEDLDKDLEGLLGDLELGDTDDAPADSDAGEVAADSEDTGGGAGEGVELDDDLASMLADSQDAGDDTEDTGADQAGDDLSGGGEDILAGAEDILTDGMEDVPEGQADILTGAPRAASAAPRRQPARPAAPPLPVLSDDQTVNLEFLLDIKLHVTFEVGRSKMLISDLLTLGQGSVIELHRLVGDELDLLVNGRLVAKGEVVVVNEKFGCKITEIIPPEERVKHLGTI